jgi:AAA ATPase containing von Willebrand factor type A (vWA) domain
MGKVAGSAAKAGAIAMSDSPVIPIMDAVALYVFISDLIDISNKTNEKLSKSEEKVTEPEEASEDEKKRTENLTKGESEVWQDLDNVKGSDRKTSGQGKSKQYYEWDHTHNDIEVYDKNGNHLGSMDPTTGEMYKPAVPGRRISP